MLTSVGGTLAGDGLVVEVPDVAMAERIRVRVPGEDVTGDIARQVPAAMLAPESRGSSGPPR